MESEAAAKVCSAGVGLVQSAPGRPVQDVCDGVGLWWLVGDVQESTYFGEGEVDEALVNGGCCVGIRQIGGYA